MKLLLVFLALVLFVMTTDAQHGNCHRDSHCCPSSKCDRDDWWCRRGSCWRKQNQRCRRDKECRNGDCHDGWCYSSPKTNG